MVGFSAAVHACTCRAPAWNQPIEAQIAAARDQADYVFSAKVVSVGKVRSRNMTVPVTLRVLERFKGVRGSIRTVMVEMGPTSMCDFPFSAGKEYLVYGTDTRTKNSVGTRSMRASVSICLRTRPISNAADDLRLLREGRPRDRGAAKIPTTPTAFRSGS